MKIKDIHKLKMPYQYKVKGVNWILNRMTKYIENYLIRKSDIHSCIQLGANKVPVIVSLTTYPARSEKVQWTIKSLLNQNVKIDRLIIWLAEEQYPDKKVPDEIKQYEEYNLEVRFCDDLKSHKKYYYTMMENPNAIIITVDDDVIYPEDTIEKLLVMHEKFPDAVICNQARWMKFCENNLTDYNTWTPKISPKLEQPSFYILPIGEGGVLYPEGCLHTEVYNKKVIMEKALSADDLWLKFMAVKNGTKAMVSQKNQTGLCGVISKSGNDSMLNIRNVQEGLNDIVIKNLSEEYSEVMDVFMSEL